ncbi:site-specific integrase [Agromyces neolithicus]|uniref:Site-specific integrase n=1 Tax=Agromyces neolithicus TaxID=269420 RepID=A0ABN2MBR0_9MICO
MSRAAASTTAVWSRRDAPQEGDVGDARVGKSWGKADVVASVAPAPHLPHPHGDLDAAPAETLIAAACSVLPRSSIQLDKRARSIRRLVEHLSAFPGATWQERWEASGWESSSTPLASLNPSPTASWTMTSGFSWLVALRVLVPSLRVLRRNAVSDFARIFLASQRDDDLAVLVTAIESAPVSATMRNKALTELACMLAVQAIPASDITPAGIMHFGVALREVSTAENKHGRKLAGALIWQVLFDAGKFPEGTPVTMKVATVGGRKSVTEMVDTYGIANTAVRQLLIDYVTHRSALGMDYGTVSNLVRALTRNFWCVVERVNPDQRDLDLDEVTYDAWRADVDTVETPDGRRPRQSIWDLLIAVRALYLDVQSWAVEDPGRWGPWVARCPIPPIASRGYSAGRRRLAERIADRTRTRQPMLDLLVDHVRVDRDRLSALLAAAESVSEPEFKVGGVSYVRIVGSRSANAGKYPQKGPRARRGAAIEPAPDAAPMRVRRAEGGPVIDVQADEARAFWTWAIIEVLRLTGIRHEELLELSHLSVRQYRRPNGEVVALLVVTPSKSDRERVIPMSPELLHVIAQIIHRHTERLRTIPLVRRWDPYERQHSEPLPFLFQHSVGQVRGVMSPTLTARLIRRACEEVAVGHPEFDGLSFTPHDFRRLFATDLVNNGLPIHIGAALLGHANLQTTRGYVAVFDEDVVRHDQLHLARRRQLRPKDEYRDATNAEWQEFEEHFDKRKVELGACGRPYGTPCAHEHACVRCPMLHVEPQMVDRLDDIETDLIARQQRAESEGWRGEIEGIEVTLDHLRTKRERARRLGSIGPVALPMPVVRTSPQG